MNIDERLSLIRIFLEFIPRVLLKKCDSEKQKNTIMEIPRKRPTSHSASAPAEPMPIEQPEETRRAVVDFDAASLLHIKFGKSFRTNSVLKSVKALNLTMYLNVVGHRTIRYRRN